MDALAPARDPRPYPGRDGAIPKMEPGIRLFTEFTNSAPITDQGVHAVKGAKGKARAGLRVFRESLIEEIHRKENVTLGDAGADFPPCEIQSLYSQRLILFGTDT